MYGNEYVTQRWSTLLHCLLMWNVSLVVAVPAEADMLTKNAHVLLYPRPPMLNLRQHSGFSYQITLHHMTASLCPFCPGPMFLMSHSQRSLIPVWLRYLQFWHHTVTMNSSLLVSNFISDKLQFHLFYDFLNSNQWLKWNIYNYVFNFPENNTRSCVHVLWVNEFKH